MPHRPRQIEFARPNLTSTVMSKQKLLQLVEGGWSPAGTTRGCRRSAVLRPIRVVIENYPNGTVEQMDVAVNHEDPSAGTGQVPFSKVLHVEQEHCREVAPPTYYQLAPGREVRLRSAYFIKCVGVVKDGYGTTIELRCTCDLATRGGDSPDHRKVKAGTRLSGLNAIRCVRSVTVAAGMRGR